MTSNSDLFSFLWSPSCGCVCEACCVLLCCFFVLLRCVVWCGGVFPVRWVSWCVLCSLFLQWISPARPHGDTDVRVLRATCALRSFFLLSKNMSNITFESTHVELMHAVVFTQSGVPSNSLFVSCVFWCFVFCLFYNSRFHRAQIN